MPVFRDLRRNRLHLSLQIAERLVSDRRQLCGRNVDAVVLEIQRILLGGKTEIGTRLGKHSRLRPRVVLDQLSFQFLVRLLPAGQFVLLQECGNAFQIIGIPRQLGFNLGACGIHHTRLRHLLGNALLQDLCQRLITRFQPGILPDPNHRGRPAFRRSLLVQQDSQPAKDHLAGIQKIHFVGSAEVLLSELQFNFADYDLQILRDFRLLLLSQGSLQRREHGLFLMPLLILVGQRWLGYLGVKLA